MVAELAMFGLKAHGLDARMGSRDRGASFPESDSKDLCAGARFIPGAVTLARREGKFVEFVQACRNSTCWYWQFEDGKRIYHWERWVMEWFQHDGHEACPACGNPHIRGGVVQADPPEWAKADAICPSCGGLMEESGMICFMGYGGDYDQSERLMKCKACGGEFSENATLLVGTSRDKKRRRRW